MGQAPDGIVRSLADVLLNMLSLELIYVHVAGPPGARAVEVFCSKHHHGDADPEAIRPLLQTLLAGRDAPATVPDPFGTGTLRVAVTRFDVEEDGGVLISGSRNGEFPDDEENVLLGIAANQAATALQRWRVEDRLRQSDARSGAILETALDCIITMDHNGNVVDFNPAAEKTFGYRRADVVGQQLADLIIPGPFRERHQRGMAHYLATGEGPILGKRVELPALHADGVEFPVELTVTRIPGEGRPVFVAYLRDISERKQSEAVLLQSAARFRGLIDQAPFAVHVFYPDGRTLQVNRAWEELWGVKSEEIRDYNILRDRQLKEKGVLRYIQRGFAGHATRIPAIQYNPDDTVPGVTRHTDPRRWLSAVIYPLRDSEGEITEVVLIQEDITARKQLEGELHLRVDELADAGEQKEKLLASLRESEQNLRLLADTIPQLAWMARPDGYIFWFNQRWYEYTGTTPEQSEGWGWQSVHDPNVLPSVLERWTTSIESGEPFDMVFPLRGADGQFRPFLTRINPLCDEEAGILYWFGTNTDISDIKSMEEALREADRRKDEFLATLAHELRNPLAPIRNSLQILNMPTVDTATAQQTRQLMERQVHHMVRLVDDLLDVSRAMRGKIELRRKPVELATVVARAVETAQPLIEVQNHELVIALPEESLFLHADPVRLSQVIGNLLTNAAKYSEPGARILLSASREGDEAHIRVVDNGIGIAADVLPHIFDLFVQADPSTTRNHSGLGIGLTLVKNLVELHGGTVEARSAGLGNGSEFLVHLPLMFWKQQISDNGDRCTVMDAVTSGHRLLVVDNNVDAASTLATLLHLQGYRVRTAYDGLTALKVAEEFAPALIFLDIGMPGMDGCEVARRLRQMSRLDGTRLVALTGWGQEDDRRRTREAGFDRHLVKPLQPEVLESLLADLEPETDL